MLRLLQLPLAAVSVLPPLTREVQDVLGQQEQEDGEKHPAVQLQWPSGWLLSVLMRMAVELLLSWLLCLVSAP